MPDDLTSPRKIDILTAEIESTPCRIADFSACVWDKGSSIFISLTVWSLYSNPALFFVKTPVNDKR
jgi:hypothetical protein